MSKTKKVPKPFGEIIDTISEKYSDVEKYREAYEKGMEAQRMSDDEEVLKSFSEGFEVGYSKGIRKGREDEKRRQHRYAWLKLFLVVFFAVVLALSVFGIIFR